MGKRPPSSIVLLLLLLICLSILLNIRGSVELSSWAVQSAEQELIYLTNQSPLPELRHRPAYPSLQLPFYVYDNGLNWENATLMGMPFHKLPYLQGKTFTYFKHLDDYWLLQGALQHPMRTQNPEEAKLFFVPTLMNALFESLHMKTRVGLNGNIRFCVNGVCGPQLIPQANTLLAESEWFRRSGGRDHIIVSSHSDHRAAYNWFTYEPDRSHLKNCSKIIFEDRRSDEGKEYIEMPNLYVSEGCLDHETRNKSSDIKNSDFTMVASLHENQKDRKKKKRFQDRRTLCSWLQARASPDAVNYNVSICGKGPQCPTLSNAKWGFHVKGDTWGANRLQDTILSGTVPIFTHKKQYDVVPDFIPWRGLSEFIPLQSSDSGADDAVKFHESLQGLLQRSTIEYERKRQLGLEYAPAMDFINSGHITFDLYMASFAKKLGLQ